MILYTNDSISNADLGKKPILIVFPFAGGNAYSYRAMTKHLEGEYDIICPELPGRGELADSPAEEDSSKLIDFIFLKWIKPLHLKAPYVLYGHSMGGLLVYLLLQKIVKEKIRLPLHIVVSGRNSPSIKRKKIISTYASEAFWNELKEMGGVPEAILADEEMKQYFEPILRSDFRLVETYQYLPVAPNTVPITVIFGSDEDIKKEDLFLWKQETTAAVDFIELPGGHFFIFEQVTSIVSLVKNIVRNKTRS